MDLLSKLNKAIIKADGTKDEYSIGLRNGLRYAKFLIDGKAPFYEEPYDSRVDLDIWKEIKCKSCVNYPDSAICILCKCPDNKISHLYYKKKEDSDECTIYSSFMQNPSKRVEYGTDGKEYEETIPP